MLLCSSLAADCVALLTVALHLLVPSSPPPLQRRCCLLFIVLAVLVVILAPTLLKTVGNA